jgi:hypothetical protein
VPDWPCQRRRGGFVVAFAFAFAFAFARAEVPIVNPWESA